MKGGESRRGPGRPGSRRREDRWRANARDRDRPAGQLPATPYPITPGHEFAGEVVARGADAVPRLPEGTRVAVDPSLYCGWCRKCRAGRDNLCENWAAIGDTVSGAFAEFRS